MVLVSSLQHLILPSITPGAAVDAVIARVPRSSMKEEFLYYQIFKP
jgi:ABC-type dipeptide/oligopeptide/nickel transport system permease component